MKYGYIDSLRGIAILMVMLVHTSQVAYGLEGFVFYFSAYGQMGVQLFFIVSAFTLCLSFEGRRGEKHAIKSFFIRRVFRIAPAYIIIGLLGYMLLRVLIQYVETKAIGLPALYSPLNILSNIFFFHGMYEPGSRVVPGGWSIGTEMLFYLIFPIVFMFLKERLSGVMVFLFPILILLCSYVIINYVFNYDIKNNDFIYFSLINQMAVFGVGFTLYFLYRSNVSLFARVETLWLLWLFLIGSFATGWFGWLSDIKSAFSLVPFFAAVSFLPLIELFKRVDFLNGKLLRSIGEHSFSMYLIHFVFAHQLSTILNKLFLLDFLGPTLALVVTYMITVFLTYNLSKITYIYIEKRFINMGRSLIKRTFGALHSTK